VQRDFGGHFPRTVGELLTLPGIGPYTAAAVAAIAFGEPVTPVDGNIERVVARLFAVETPLPQAKSELRRLAGSLTPQERAGDFAQAMMDLGATVCAPKRPSCLMCPLKSMCRARADGIESTLPARQPKAERPVRHGIAFLALREDGAVLLRRRPEEGLLASMIEVPSTTWVENAMGAREALRAAPVKADWWAVPGEVIHTFTHFRLELQIYRAVVPLDAELTFWADSPRCRWVHRRDLDGEALPSVMRKILAKGLSET
jgi:A/G-specific adenine glycosylase